MHPQKSSEKTQVTAVIANYDRQAFNKLGREKCQKQSQVVQGENSV